MLQNWELKNYEFSKVGMWKLLKNENKKFKQIVTFMDYFGLFTVKNEEKLWISFLFYLLWENTNRYK